MGIAHDNGVPRWRLRNADSALKILITAFLVLLTSGYAIGLMLVDHTSSGTVEGLSEEFRGTPEQEEVAELKYAKSVHEMYIFLHNHILSLSLVFFIVGGLTYVSSIVGPGVKIFLILEPFVAIASTFGGIWLMRFVSEYFSWLVLISGASMVLTYVAMVMLIMKELWFTEA